MFGFKTIGNQSYNLALAHYFWIRNKSFFLPVNSKYKKCKLIKSLKTITIRGPGNYPIKQENTKGTNNSCISFGIQLVNKF